MTFDSKQQFSCQSQSAQPLRLAWMACWPALRPQGSFLSASFLVSFCCCWCLCHHFIIEDRHWVWTFWELLVDYFVQGVLQLCNFTSTYHKVANSRKGYFEFLTIFFSATNWVDVLLTKGYNIKGLFKFWTILRVLITETCY